jgi:hypothetical protein
MGGKAPQATAGQVTESPVAAGGDQVEMQTATFSDEQPAMNKFKVDPVGSVTLENTGVDPSTSPSSQPSAVAVGTTNATSASDATVPTGGATVKTTLQLKYGIAQSQLDGVSKTQQSRAMAEFGPALGEVW